jgi:ubiquinone biosynthesis accessory factor UbiJ
VAGAATLAADAANRALAGEAWAREKLAGHAGKRFTLASGPFDATFAIGDGGELAAADAGAPVALTLHVAPLAVPALASDPSRWAALVRSEGDASLASSLEELAQTLPWFVERAFGALLGPIAGQAVADAGRTLLAIPDRLSRHAAASLGEFAGESNALATRRELAAHASEVAGIASRVDALAERVAALAAPRQKRRPKAT